MLIDISQEVYSCRVFPGDPAPVRQELMRMEQGAICNLTAISMCTHNGTHVDAPRHFFEAGRAIDEMGLEPFVGDCYVAACTGEIDAQAAAEIMERAHDAGAERRILIAGEAVLHEAGAEVFARAGILLFGNESQTVGPPDAPAAVHRIMLGAQIVLLEGIVLENVPAGRYVLSAAPLNLGGGDGAPCRAYLRTVE